MLFISKRAIAGYRVEGVKRATCVAVGEKHSLALQTWNVVPLEGLGYVPWLTAAPVPAPQTSSDLDVLTPRGSTQRGSASRHLGDGHARTRDAAARDAAARSASLLGTIMASDSDWSQLLQRT